MANSVTLGTSALNPVTPASVAPTAEEVIREQIAQWDHQIRHAQREKKKLQAQLQLVQVKGAENKEAA